MELRLIELLRLALKYSCQNIHIQRKYSEVSIQMLIDGKLRDVISKFDDYKLIRYLEYLANLDVGKLLMPQTGNFEMEVDGKLLKLRFAVIDSQECTSAVLRILNYENKIEYTQEPIRSFSNEIIQNARKAGLYIISGPTNSGKTTLAYNILRSLENVKKYSAEDPIEMYEDSIVQLAINENIGFTMSEAIKQILRHEPDVLFVSEVGHDLKAVNEIITAVQIGHTVLTTMHSSSCENSISNLVELGVDENKLKDCLRSIINLRLEINEDGTCNQPATIWHKED